MDDDRPVTRETHPPSASMPDEFDRTYGMLHGLKNTLTAGPSNLTVLPPWGIGGSRTFVITTIRERIPVSGDENRTTFKDTVFLQIIGMDGGRRIVLPPQITDAIARQRDSLTTRVRQRAAKAAAATRKARGIQPNFTKRPPQKAGK